MSVNEDSSDCKLDRQDYPYFTDDEFKTFHVQGKQFVEKVHLSCKRIYETRIAKYSLGPVKGKNLEMNLNIVICGKAGSGKSSTANAILGKEAFKASSSSNSVTKKSLDNSCTYGERRITVVDTPGIFDTDGNDSNVKEELARMAFLLKDGVHCFIICMSAGESRFTKDVKEMLELIKQRGEGNFFQYCMLAYTKAETEMETCTLFDFLITKKDNEDNSRFLADINSRVVAVNNKCLVPAEALRNRDELIKMVDVVVAQNIDIGNPVTFTNDVFKKAGLLEEKLTSVVQNNIFHQILVNATIEVAKKNSSSWNPSSVSFDKFLKEVISILQARNKSEKDNIITDLFINGKVNEKYVNQIKQIYKEIEPELSKFWLKIGYITLAPVLAAAAGAEAAVAAAAVGTAVGIISYFV